MVTDEIKNLTGCKDVLTIQIPFYEDFLSEMKSLILKQAREAALIAVNEAYEKYQKK